MAKLIRYSVDEDGIADYTPDEDMENEYCTWCGSLLPLGSSSDICDDCIKSDDYLESLDKK
jgi:hypothetical protein